MIGWLKSVKPRRISPDNDFPPLLLFTDGSCEFLKAVRDVLAGVLIDTCEKKQFWFGAEVPIFLQNY